MSFRKQRNYLKRRLVGSFNLDLLDEFLNRTSSIKPVTSNIEVNTHFAFFEESETEYVKKSMTMMTFPFEIVLKPSEDTTDSELTAYFFKTDNNPRSPIHFKQKPMADKSLKSSQLLNMLYQTCETIVEEPTLEIQETDMDACAKDSDESLDEIKSSNSHRSSRSSKKGSPNSGSPSESEIIMISDLEQRSISFGARSPVEVFGIAKRIPKGLIASENTSPNIESVFRKIDRTMENDYIFLRSDRSARLRDDRLNDPQAAEFNNGDHSRSKSGLVGTINHLVNLKERYSKSSNKDPRRALSPKSIDEIRNQLKAALKEKGKVKVDQSRLDSSESACIISKSYHIDTKHIYRSDDQIQHIIEKVAENDNLSMSAKRRDIQMNDTRRPLLKDKVAQSPHKNTDKIIDHICRKYFGRIGEGHASKKSIDIGLNNNLQGPDSRDKLSQGCRNVKITTTLTNRSDISASKISKNEDKVSLAHEKSPERGISLSTLRRLFGCNKNCSNDLAFRQMININTPDSSDQAKNQNKKIINRVSNLANDESITKPNISDIHYNQRETSHKQYSVGLSSKIEQDLNEKEKRINMIFNNLFLGGVTNFSLCNPEAIKDLRHDPLSSTVLEDSLFCAKLQPKCKDSKRQPQRVNHYLPKKLSNATSCKHSKKIETSLSSADRSIRSTAHKSTCPETNNYLQARKNTIGTAAEILSMAKLSPKSKFRRGAVIKQIQIKSDKTLQHTKSNLSYDASHPLQNRHLPIQNSKFSTQLYSHKHENLSSIIADNDKSCAAIREKVKNMLEKKQSTSDMVSPSLRPRRKAEMMKLAQKYIRGKNT